MHWSTWRKLRHEVAGLPNETMDSYIKRIIREVENGKSKEIVQTATYEMALSYYQNKQKKKQ